MQRGIDYKGAADRPSGGFRTQLTIIAVTLIVLSFAGPTAPINQTHQLGAANPSAGETSWDFISATNARPRQRPYQGGRSSLMR